MDRLLSMRAFQKVIDEGGFASAARAMDMSPAGVTRLVTDLEQHLGVRLMQRSTRKMALTEAGQAYLLRVRSILSEIDDAEAVVAQSSNELRGALHVLSPRMFASYFLARQVSRWFALYPNVVLHLHIDTGITQSRVEEFDVTFMVVGEDFNADIVARPIGSFDLVLCASPDYLKRHGTPSHPQELEGHHYLRFLWPQASKYSSKNLRLCKADGTEGEAEAPLQVVMQSDDYDTLYHAAWAGAGIAVLPHSEAIDFFSSGELVHVLPEWMLGRHKVYAALPTRKLLPARTKAFLDFAMQLSLNSVAPEKLE